MDFSVCLVAGDGTLCHGLVDSVVIGQMFDSIILEVFSDLSDSVILCSQLTNSVLSGGILVEL